MTNNIKIEKDLVNRKIVVTREFKAPKEKVWSAWTEREILDKWWAPKPWKAETKTMNFTDGGMWLYAMVGPQGEQHWSRTDFEKIDTGNSFTAYSRFSDENGGYLDKSVSSHWQVKFASAGANTIVETTLTFDNIETMNTLVAMGFEGGFTMGLNNLEELLASS
jgi:uncharacterized protein YndB with AHSA1/START domain